MGERKLLFSLPLSLSKKCLRQIDNGDSVPKPLLKGYWPLRIPYYKKHVLPFILMNMGFQRDSVPLVGLVSLRY